MSSTLPPEVETARSRVGIGFKEVLNAQGTYAAHAYAKSGFDNSLHVDEFCRSLSARILTNQNEELVFELVGLDAPIANAIRRILIAEVPTIAIETVSVHDNSSIVPDEMLAHRLGLVPLAVDPRRFDMRQAKDEPTTAKNTLKLRLKARCDKNPNAPRDGIAPPGKLYSGAMVLSGAVEYVPFGGEVDQLRLLNLHEQPKPVHDDIVLAKMRPTERIHVEMEAVKGIGKDHAKFSPVATASYRMLPEVTIKETVTGTRAQELVKLCPMGVFDIEDSGLAVVRRPRDCTMCRECIRKPEWNGVVELSRKRDHFIFSVESTGALTPETLVTEALSILTEKCKTVLSALDTAVLHRTGDGRMGEGERMDGQQSEPSHIRRTAGDGTRGDNSRGDAQPMVVDDDDSD
jgi:DNA-directed RNA polymerases I and III subunit RPAC1